MALKLELVADDDHDGMRWLDDIACADADLSEYFVAAGHTISPEAEAMCDRCPVRSECLTHAYSRGIAAGYFAKASPSYRDRTPLEEALKELAAA